MTVTSISIPLTTVTQTTTSLLVVETGPLSTVTIPSATAKNTKTITPPAVTTTSTKTLTKTKFTHTRVIKTTTQTKTATCTLPGRPSKLDKPARYSPTRLHPAALATPTTIHKGKGRRNRRPDRIVNYGWARARVEAAKQKRAAAAEAKTQAKAQGKDQGKAKAAIAGAVPRAASAYTSVDVSGMPEAKHKPPTHAKPATAVTQKGGKPAVAKSVQTKPKAGAKPKPNAAKSAESADE